MKTIANPERRPTKDRDKLPAVAVSFATTTGRGDADSGVPNDPGSPAKVRRHLLDAVHTCRAGGAVPLSAVAP